MRDGAPPPEASACASRPDLTADLRGRLAEAGREIGAREAAHHAELEDARRRCDALRARVVEAVGAFHAASAAAGSPHLRVDVTPVRLDEKHVRAMEFEVRRGRHAGVITVKSRGEVTLVGPFRTGKTEGPCRTFPWDAEDDVCKALGDFLLKFLEEAATP